MELSKKERLMLINQYRILSILNPDGASSYNVRIKMLENGYSLHYDEMVSWIDDGMSREQCQEIIDILEMYRCLWHSYKKLRDKKDISKKDVKFPGFDAVEEEKELNYAEYVLYDLKRYREFHQRRRLPNHDSYKVMLGQYRAMLSVWKSLGHKKLLTRDEIIQILDGGRAATPMEEKAPERAFLYSENTPAGQAPSADGRNGEEGRTGPSADSTDDRVWQEGPSRDDADAGEWHDAS